MSELDAVHELLDGDFNERLLRSVLQAAVKAEMPMSYADALWLIDAIGLERTVLFGIAPGERFKLCTPYGVARIRITE